MTNQENIKLMGRCELAEFLYVISSGIFEFDCHGECKSCKCTAEECTRKIMNWLSKESEE